MEEDTSPLTVHARATWNKVASGKPNGGMQEDNESGWGGAQPFRTGEVAVFTISQSDLASC